MANFINGQGWKPLFTLRHHYYPDWVRLFYANLTHSTEDRKTTLHSRVRGVDITITEENTIALFGIKGEGHTLEGEKCDAMVGGAANTIHNSFYGPSTRFYYKSMPVAAFLCFCSKLAHMLIVRCLVPRKGSKSLTSHLVAAIRYCIHYSIPLNSYHLITQNMLSHRYGKASLPYGMVITKLCERKVVQLDPNEDRIIFKISSQLISHPKLNLANIMLKENGWFWDDFPVTKKEVNDWTLCNIKRDQSPACSTQGLA